MMISESAWVDYVSKQSKLSQAAIDGVKKFLATGLDISTQDGRRALLDISMALVQKYGTASATLACEMYDAIAEASGMALLPAEIAELPDYGDVAKTVNGVLKYSQNEELLAGSVGRLVKLSGQDTTLKNALRDGAEWAWIPHGDTCAFCITLASRGWQRASKKALKDGHAEHIHGNCDCAYAIRFSENDGYRGYHPDLYRQIYDDAEGHSSKEKVNAMRREFYAENKDEINAKKRAAYEARINASAAEEMDV